MQKTILITGTSTGIGKETAKLFAKNGWNVVATMRNPEKEQELTQYKNILISQLELRDVESIDNAIETGIKHFGKIDALINNAAFGQYGLFEAVTPEQIREQFEVNVFGTMNVTRQILPHFRKNKGGLIINVSSAGGRIGIPMISPYVSSKFALEGWSEAVSYELASQNIILKLIEPGGVDTPFDNTANQKFAFDSALTSYKSFISAFGKKFESMHNGIATAEQVADGIYIAVSDETDQFRYVIGNDAKGWIDARTSMNDFDYTSHMREIFKLD